VSAQPHLYQPRAHVTLFPATLGTLEARISQANTRETFNLEVDPTKIRLTSNSWREADEVEITCTFDQAGLDVRALRSAEVNLWIWDNLVDSGPSITNSRFLGIVTDISREFSESTRTVTLRALDFTTLFLEMKPYFPQFLPKMTQTLFQAWQTVCRFTGLTDFSDLNAPTIISTVCDPDSKTGANDGAPRIPLVAWGNVNLNMTIGASLPQRIAALSNMQAKTGTDAWTVWTEICANLGLITFIRGADCIVTAATDLFTTDDPPLLIYGQNVLTITERRDIHSLSHNNVCVRSYDGTSGTTLESFFPPTSSPLAARIRQKKVLPNTAKKGRAAMVSEGFDLFDTQLPITSQASLDLLAEMIWFDRIRSQMSGTLTTREMRVGTTDQSAFAGWAGVPNEAQNFSLLNLQAGDNITIKIEDTALDTIQSLPTDELKVAALLARNYSPTMAQAIVDNLQSITQPGFPSTFLVHSVTIELDVGSHDAEGSFMVTVEYINQLDLGGESALQVVGAPPITGLSTEDGRSIADIQAQISYLNK
jgi:hypothetical protein